MARTLVPAAKAPLGKVAPAINAQTVAKFQRYMQGFQGMQSDGQKLFDTNCAKCHGPDGTGNTVVGKAVGAKDLGSAEAKKLTDAEIFMQIDQGKGNMPPFGGTLNKAQIDSLIPIVRAFGKTSAGAKKPS